METQEKEYKVEWAEIRDGKIVLPDGAIPIKVGLMLTGPLMGADTKLRDGVCYIVPLQEDSGVLAQHKGN